MFQQVLGTRIVISKAVKRELSFVIENWEFLIGHPIRASLSASAQHFSLCSDALDMGNGVINIAYDQNIVYKRIFLLLRLHVPPRIKNFQLSLTLICLIMPSQRIRSLYITQIVNFVCWQQKCNTTTSSFGYLSAWKRLKIKVYVSYLSRYNPIIQLDRQIDIFSYIYKLQLCQVIKIKISNIHILFLSDEPLFKTS